MGNTLFITFAKLRNDLNKKELVNDSVSYKKDVLI